MGTSTPYSTHQEFFEVLLRVKDSENAPDDSDEEEEKGNAQKNNTNKDKWQQRNPNSSTAPLCRRCKNHHFRECRQGGSGRCFTCGHMGHRANQCPQNQQKPQPPALPPAVPLQQIQGPSGYTPTGYGGAYRYQGVFRGSIPVSNLSILSGAVDHSGILEDSSRTLRLPLAVLICRGSLISPVRNRVSKDEIEIGRYLGRESEAIVKEKMLGLSSLCGAE
ncbi:hypothetical protein D8674_000207 [Pyrus ussuriensis x Pyrus communis]|uniref:CCHC-type domain-containing protein n=1 Tax=Pyrus ussuriensis x Pyrus communis TaxID=2448454 RepID=A0A5N5F2T9_9ROSA|nr:hypothetical protein D8674_000207 [Pyrus ussuriensis x Pyrus communis]